MYTLPIEFCNKFLVCLHGEYLIKSSAIINLRGVSTKLYFNFVVVLKRCLYSNKDCRKIVSDIICITKVIHSSIAGYCQSLRSIACLQTMES